MLLRPRATHTNSQHLGLNASVLCPVDGLALWETWRPRGATVSIRHGRVALQWLGHSPPALP